MFIKKLVYQLLIFCSGASKETLEKCPDSDRNIQIGIGFSVIFTAIIASFSGGYAFFTVFELVEFSIALGGLWGLTILNIDRLLLISVKRKKNLFFSLSQLAPRVILAALIAFIIVTPLELRIFLSEINYSLDQKLEEKIKKIENEFKQNISQRNKEFSLKKNEIKNSIKLEEEKKKNLNENIDKLYVKKETAFGEAECERLGTCGSGKAGLGPHYKAMYEEYLHAKKNHDEQKKILNVRIDKIDVHIKNLEKILLDYEESGQSSEDKIDESKKERIDHERSIFSRSFLTQFKEFSELRRKDNDIWAMANFLTFLFIFIEVIPIFAKIIFSSKNYDRVREILDEEKENEINKKRMINKNEKFHFDKNKKELELKTIKLDEEFKLQEELVSNSISKQRSKIEVVFKKWMESELPNQIGFKILLKAFEEMFQKVVAHYPENETTMFNEKKWVDKFRRLIQNRKIYIILILFSIFVGIIFISVIIPEEQTAEKSIILTCTMLTLLVACFPYLKGTSNLKGNI